ncbi:MAG: hypothetical protein ACYC54_11950 [Sedimentisphaerales bacterium]
MLRSFVVLCIGLICLVAVPVSAVLPNIDFPYGFYTADVIKKADSNGITVLLERMKAANMNIVGEHIQPGSGYFGLCNQLAKFNIQFLPHLNTPLADSKPTWDSNETVLDLCGRQLFWYGVMRSLISEGARQDAREKMQKYFSELPLCQAFGGEFTFSDDVSLPRSGPKVGEPPYVPITDYSPCAVNAFKKKTGFDAPRPEPKALVIVSGVIPENDPWLQWNLFRCKDMYADYQKVITSTGQAVSLSSRGCSMSGSIWSINHGVDPYYEYGENTSGFMAFYNYPPQPLQYLIECELARMGGKNKELWFVPFFYNGPPELRKVFAANPEYIHASFFSLLTAGAKGIIYFTYAPPESNDAVYDAVWKEAATNGKLLKDYGTLLRRLQIGDRRIALLASFSTDIYQLFAGDLDLELAEDTHRAAVRRTYLNVAQAQLPVEFIHEEQVISGSLSNYKVLLLSHVNVLRKNSYDAIVKYIESGGNVIIDQPSKIDVPGAIKLSCDMSKGYGFATINRNEVEAAVAEARKTFYPYVEPLLICDRSDVIIVPMADNKTEEHYYFVLNTRSDKGITPRFKPRKNELKWVDVFNNYKSLEPDVNGDICIEFENGSGKLLKIASK